jgi:nucleoid-associated protein YgaU
MEIRVPKDPSNVQGRPAGEAAVGERDGRSGRGEDDAGPDPVMEYLEYRVKKNDTLTGIAYEIYGRASLWTLIRDANPKVGDDGRELRAGMTLRIPPKPAE